MKATLQLRLLGRPTVHQNTEPVTGFISTKSQALLFYLALLPGEHTRERVAALLWPDMPMQKAASNLRNVLSNLRKLVGDHVIIKRLTLAFDFDTPHEIDVLQFLQHIDSAEYNLAHPGIAAQTEIQDLQAAVDHYEDDFLTEFSLFTAEPFEEWMLKRRSLLQGNLQSVLLKLGQLYANAQEPHKGIVAIERLLMIEPWDEEGYRLLMIFQARLGRRNAALGTYERCRQILLADLQVDPSAETIRLYERLRVGGSITPNNLPNRLTAFVGRKQELSVIRNRLNDVTCRLLTITGIGGAGKTQLVLEAALRASEPHLDDTLFDDGIFFLPLTRFDPATYDKNIEIGMLTLVAAEIGFEFVGRMPWRQQLFSYLKDKRMLLIFDNFEHVLGQALLLASLLEATSKVKLLVTSRERLNLNGEWLLPLFGLTYPKQIGDGGALFSAETSYDALTLFEQTVERIVGHPATEADRAPFIRICNAVEGLPLGIELASGWLRTLSAESVATYIEESFDILHTQERNVPQRHRSLRQLFDSTWQRLSQEEQLVLMQLSVLRGVFSSEAANVISDRPWLILASLVDKSLLRKLGDDRYGLFGYVRQYASEKLQTDSGRYHEAKNSFARHFARLIHKQTDHITGSDPVSSLAYISDNRENFYSAWKWALEQKDADVVELMQAPLSSYWRRTNTSEIARSFMPQALAIFDQDHYPRLHGKLRLEYGLILREFDDLQQGIDNLLLAIPLLQQHDAYGALMAAHTFSGRFLTSVGDFAAAEMQLAAAIALQERVDDSHLLCLTYFQRGVLQGYIGITVNESGDSDAAQDLFKQERSLYFQALDVARAGQHLEDQMIVLGMLGHCHVDIEEFGLAETYFHEALNIGRKINDKRNSWHYAYRLAVLESRRGDSAAAVVHWTDTVNQAHLLANTDAIVYALLAAASILRHKQHHVESAMIYSFLLNNPPGEIALYIETKMRLRHAAQQLEPEQFKQAQANALLYDLDSILQFARARIGTL